MQCVIRFFQTKEKGKRILPCVSSEVIIVLLTDCMDKMLVMHDILIVLQSVILDVLASNRKGILSDLGSECIVFSSFQDCIMVTRETVLKIPVLNSTQEEADTKVVLHASHALARNEGVTIFRSHSRDIDITVIALSHFVHDTGRVIIDSNTGRNRKAFKMSDIDLTSQQGRSLIGFHAFTGYDQQLSILSQRQTRLLETH